jgi:hypothetical protein
MRPLLNSGTLARAEDRGTQDQVHRLWRGDLANYGSDPRRPVRAMREGYSLTDRRRAHARLGTKAPAA